MRVKQKTFTQTLAEKFGGKWKYIARLGRWECEDGVRTVQLVTMDMHDENSISKPCMYFTDGRAPMWVN